MEITILTEKDLLLIKKFLADPHKKEDDRFAFALKLIQEEGKTIKLIAE